MYFAIRLYLYAYNYDQQFNVFSKDYSGHINSFVFSTIVTMLSIYTNNNITVIIYYC